MFRASAIMTFMLLLTLPLRAQDRYPAAMQAQLDSIESYVNQFRQLEPLAESPLSFPSRMQLEAFLRQRFVEDFPPHRLATDMLFYRALDLAAADIDLPDLLFNFFLTWLGGYYHLDDESINIVLFPGITPDEELSITQQTTYAHEYVHALQDQHFDLQRIIDLAEAADNRDFRLAVQSLIEGDANYMMITYLQQLLDTDANAVQRAYAAIPQPAIDPQLPAVIIESTSFPYRQGFLFVAEVERALGWEGVNQALRAHPPTTTEQIYHPQRYLAGEGAIVVEIPDVRGIVGEGWQLAYDGPVGEFYLRQHLDVFLDEPRINLLTTGWGGDRMQIFTHDGSDQLIWLLFQTWDTREDAAEFARGYSYLLERKYRSVADDDNCWSATTTQCFVQISESETRISSAPEKSVALALLQVSD